MWTIRKCIDWWQWNRETKAYSILAEYNVYKWISICSVYYLLQQEALSSPLTNDCSHLHGRSSYEL